MSNEPREALGYGWLPPYQDAPPKASLVVTVLSGWLLLIFFAGCLPDAKRRRVAYRVAVFLGPAVSAVLAAVTGRWVYLVMSLAVLALVAWLAKTPRRPDPRGE